MGRKCFDIPRHSEGGTRGKRGENTRRLEGRLGSDDPTTVGEGRTMVWKLTYLYGPVVVRMDGWTDSARAICK